jgi:hypothetical protein
MRSKSRRRSMAVLAGTMIVGGPVLAACASGPTYEGWAATDGAAGRINLDAVQDAFKKSDSVTEFESRVNKIYEGDGVVLIRADQDGEKLTLEGFEDLDGSRTIEDSKDDLLFSIVRQNEQNDIRGHGANGYYHNSFGGGGFLFGYMLASSFNRGSYYTPVNRVGTLRNQRANYRNTPTYRSQVSQNSSYFNRQKTFAGSNYTSAGRNLSSNRQTYQAGRKTSGSFRSSGTGVRSSFGSRSGGRVNSARSSRGGFGGFGGSQRIVGLHRHKL